MIKGTLCFPSDHPALRGHFPGNPIIPGVVLLDGAADFITRTLQKDIKEIRRARFKKPLDPGRSCVLELEETNQANIKAHCHINGDTVFTANFVVAPAEQEWGAEM